MTKIGRVNFPPQLGMRLMISGEWSPECDAEIQRGGFDRLELLGGEYADFLFLEPHADKISSLWISAPSKSSRGLDALHNLETLSVSYLLDKNFDFSALPKLRHLNIDAWHPRYGASVFNSQSLESIKIEGYSGKDCAEFGKLGKLRLLRLAKGSLVTLKGLSHCPHLASIDLSHIRTLSDIAELAYVSSLRDLELGASLSAAESVEVLSRLTQLQKLTFSPEGRGFDDVKWLLHFSSLRSLLLPLVKHIDWEALLSSKNLEMLRVRSPDLRGTTVEMISMVAEQHGHRLKSIQAFGTRSIPGYSIAFLTGKGQNE